MTVAIESIKKGEEEKLSAALHMLREEDPTVLVEVSPELKQILLHCQGELHLAVIKWKIEHIHNLEVQVQQTPHTLTAKPSAVWRNPATAIKSKAVATGSLEKYLCA